MTSCPLQPTVMEANDSSRVDSEFRYTLFPIFYSIIFVLGVLANSYVLWVFAHLYPSKKFNEIKIDPPGCFSGTPPVIWPLWSSSSMPHTLPPQCHFCEDRHHPAPFIWARQPGHPCLLPFSQPLSCASLSSVHSVSQLILTAIHFHPLCHVPSFPLVLWTVAIISLLSPCLWPEAPPIHSVHNSQSHIP